MRFSKNEQPLSNMRSAPSAWFPLILLVSECDFRRGVVYRGAARVNGVVADDVLDFCLSPSILLTSVAEWAFQVGSSVSFQCCVFAAIVLLYVASVLDALPFFLVLLGILVDVHVCCSWGRPCFWCLLSGVSALCIFYERVELNSEHLLICLGRRACVQQVTSAFRFWFVMLTP